MHIAFTLPRERRAESDTKHHASYIHVQLVISCSRRALWWGGGEGRSRLHVQSSLRVRGYKAYYYKAHGEIHSLSFDCSRDIVCCVIRHEMLRCWPKSAKPIACSFDGWKQFPSLIDSLKKNKKKNKKERLGITWVNAYSPVLGLLAISMTLSLIYCSQQLIGWRRTTDVTCTVQFLNRFIEFLWPSCSRDWITFLGKTKIFQLLKAISTETEFFIKGKGTFLLIRKRRARLEPIITCWLGGN